MTSGKTIIFTSILAIIINYYLMMRKGDERECIYIYKDSVNSVKLNKTNFSIDRRLFFSFVIFLL